MTDHLVASTVRKTGKVVWNVRDPLTMSAQSTCIHQTHRYIKKVRMVQRGQEYLGPKTLIRILPRKNNLYALEMSFGPNGFAAIAFGFLLAFAAERGSRV